MYIVLPSHHKMHGPKVLLSGGCLLAKTRRKGNVCRRWKPSYASWMNFAHVSLVRPAHPASAHAAEPGTLSFFSFSLSAHALKHQACCSDQCCAAAFIWRAPTNVAVYWENWHLCCPLDLRSLHTLRPERRKSAEVPKRHHVECTAEQMQPCKPG